MVAGEMQPYRATTTFDCVIEGLLILELLFDSIEVVHVAELRGGAEGEFSRKHSLQVGLRELYIPSIPKEKVHVDTMSGRLAYLAPSFTARMWRRQIPLAVTADLPRQPHPCR